MVPIWVTVVIGFGLGLIAAKINDGYDLWRQVVIITMFYLFGVACTINALLPYINLHK